MNGIWGNVTCLSHNFFSSCTLFGEIFKAYLGTYIPESQIIFICLQKYNNFGWLERRCSHRVIRSFCVLLSKASFVGFVTVVMLPLPVTSYDSKGFVVSSLVEELNL